jgi:hypothetical protein
MLIRYLNNPFELDLVRSDQVGLKLRLAYYSLITSTGAMPFLVAWLTGGMRRRSLFTAITGVLALTHIVWATHSVLHLWAELGGRGLP